MNYRLCFDYQVKSGIISSTVGLISFDERILHKLLGRPQACVNSIF